MGAGARAGHDASVRDSASLNGKTRLVRGICSSSARCAVDLDVVRDTVLDEEDGWESSIGELSARATWLDDKPAGCGVCTETDNGAGVGSASKDDNVRR